ncbi:MAG: iron-sulfur cluster assembly scaffold protein [Candidatus Latescibacterota bacterium]
MDFADRLTARLEELIRARMGRQPRLEPQLQPQKHGPVPYYTPEVIDHFTNPRHQGEMSPEEASGFALIGDPGCGDQMRMWIRVEDDRIVDIRFRTTGCAGSVATSSMVTELACGRTITEALTLTDDDVIAALGGTPGYKRHCSLLGTAALHAAIADYLARSESGAPAGEAPEPEPPV